MPKSPDPDQTFDQTPVPSDSLGPGLAAAFGQATEAPRSSFGGGLKPVVLPDAAGESSHIVKTQSDALPKAAQAGDRYQLSGEIARGGMGAVLRGRDVDLGRDLAIKVLLEKHAQRPEIARRFLEEAQIGGQLQHPGVVPVYDIGRFGERPFFTMKLVKGKTLAEVLAERKDLSSDRPRLLGIALQVSQTLAYAHAKGVIHRDLKPANIMVGAFGEVQVMDWGLAKVLASGGVADEEKASRLHQETKDETNIKTARSAGSNGSFGTDTEAGSLLGTPAYMPPEQANGDVTLMDRRADVFGLGAILCEILTGKPPYVGRSQEEVRRKAANGDLADAYTRLQDSGADKELITLTRLCLSPEPMDRPKDAQAVAESLSGYLDGVQERLRTAERERAVAVVREAEQRKKGRVQLALAAAIALLLLGAGAFAFWQAELAQAGRERNARNGEAVAALLGQVEEALKAGDAAKAAVVLEAAKKRSAEGGAEKDAERLKRLAADLALLRDLDAVDQFRWTVEETKMPDPVVVTTRTREALQRFGADPETVSVDEAAARVLSSVVRDRIVPALDRLLRYQKTAGVRAVLRKVDADPYRDAVRDAILAQKREKIAELAGQPAALEQPPGFAAFLGESSAIPLERKRQLLQMAVTQRPGDLGLLMTLGYSYPINQTDGADERLRWYQAAVAVAPANSAAHHGLGLALLAKADPVGAEAAFRESIRLDSNSAPAHNNLGVVLGKKQDLVGAEAAFRESIRLDRGYALAHSGLGGVLNDKKDLVGAEAACREAIRLDNKLVIAYHSLGMILTAKPDLSGAEATYREAIRLDPKNAPAYNNLGNVLVYQKDLVGAEAAFRESIRLAPKVAGTHHGLGAVLEARKDLVGAEAAFRESIRLDPKYASAQFGLGIVLREKKDSSGAETAFREAIRLDPKFTKAHINLGALLRAKPDLAGAEAAFRKAILLDPTIALVHHNLGMVLQAKSDPVGAEAAYQEAIRLDPNFANAHNSLGFALWRRKDLPGAERAFRDAIHLNPNYAQAYYNLGNVLRDKLDLPGAEAAYREAIRLDPNLAKSNYSLGNIMLQRGRYAEAKECANRALATLPEKDNLRAATSQLLQVCERMLTLESRLPKLLRGEDKAKSESELVNIATMCLQKQLYAAASRFYSEAFIANPNLAADPQGQLHYNAACSAALAAAGQGKDTAKHDNAAKSRLRAQALDWLKAELAAWAKLLDSGPPHSRPMIMRTLSHWQQDPDLSSIRDAVALAKLPADEQKAFAQLWADVAALRKKAETSATKENKR